MSGNKQREIALAILMIWWGAGHVFGSEPLVFESGEARTMLVELFTSEGCSSCPPADAWISQLKESPDLWKKIVPVALNGREWRDWFGNRALWRERPAKAGNLRVTLSNETDVTAVFTREDSRTSPLQLHVALLGSNLESDVKRGENSGRKLRHDFVVLQLARVDLIASGDRWIGPISIPKQNAEKPRALAAWVSEEDVDSPIQATGGWLTSPAR